MKFLGECFGIEVMDKEKDGLPVLVKLLIEDDEIWHEKEEFSSYWLDDLINVLTQAKNYVNKGEIK